MSPLNASNFNHGFKIFRFLDMTYLDYCCTAVLKTLSFNPKQCLSGSCQNVFPICLSQIQVSLRSRRHRWNQSCLVTMQQQVPTTFFYHFLLGLNQMKIVEYSNHPNTTQVRFSNGEFMSGYQMKRLPESMTFCTLNQDEYGTTNYHYKRI